MSLCVTIYSTKPQRAIDFTVKSVPFNVATDPVAGENEGKTKTITLVDSFISETV